MSGPLCVYALFNTKREPLAVGILTATKRLIYDLYGKGSGTPLYDVEAAKLKVAKIVNAAIANNVVVVTSDFKSLLAEFPIDRVQGVDYPVYDCCWGAAGTVDDIKIARAVVSKVLDRLATTKIKPWQRILANAAVAYQALEERGVIIGMTPQKPIWSQATYSGRSKNLVVNIQGADGTADLVNPAGATDDLHVYCDWVAADLRIASLISNDLVLQDTFIQADPYTALTEMLTTDTGTIPRADCKLQLLQAINSFDFTHPVLENIFVDLGRWLRNAKIRLETDGLLNSILDRPFKLSKARNQNPLAVLNGAFQGSVAHAMHLVVKRTWDTYGNQLLAEIHDSIAMTNKPEYVNSMIGDVTEIMCRPFAGVLDSNPFFPVKVSIGRRFREWQPIRVYRESGMEKIVHV